MSRFIFVTFFLALNTIVQILISLDDILVNLTFYSMLLVLTVHIGIILKSKKIEFFDVVVFTFAYVFFYISGLFQCNYGVFPNSLVYNPYYVTRVNILIIIFQTTYLASKIIFKSTSKPNHLELSNIENSRFEISKTVFKIIFLISLLIILKDLNVIFQRIMFKQANIGMSDTMLLIVTRTLYVLPLFLVFYLLSYKEKFNYIEYKLYFVSSTIMLLLVKNPIIERRNAIAPIILTILVFYLKKRLNNKNLILLNLFTILILFNLAAIITNTDIGLTEVSTIEFNFRFIEQFYTLHFDAYSEIIATTIFVDIFGITYGRQLLGVILFFIPRSLWPNKPTGTGSFVGQALYNNYSGYNLNFFHISNPYLSEGYINFGLVGVVFFGLVLAFISNKIEYKRRNSFEWIIYIYISFYMYYFLRGDLISGFAYLIANLIALYFAPKILDKIIKSFKKGAINKYEYKKNS